MSAATGRKYAAMDEVAFDATALQIVGSIIHHKTKMFRELNWEKCCAPSGNRFDFNHRRKWKCANSDDTNRMPSRYQKYKSFFLFK